MSENNGHPLDGRTLRAKEDQETAALATRGEMMTFLGALAQGLAPFDAARRAGRPLSYWRGLARRDAVFRASYEAACEDFGHAMAAQTLHVADEADEDSKAGVAKAKLRADVRFRLAKAYAREVFGEKVDVTSRTVDVRRTEFVSFFGVRVMKQDEASLEEVARVLEANIEQGQGQGPETVASDADGSPADAEGVASEQEGLREDEPGEPGQRGPGDPQG